MLWTKPVEQDELTYAGDTELYALRVLGAIAIPVVRWNALPSVPRADHFPPASHAAVADAWILGPGRATSSIVEYLRERLVGGDTLEKDAAVALVEQHLHALLACAERPFERPILAAHAIGARVETLYFDGAAELDWPAFAFAGDEVFLALDRERVTPAPSPASSARSRDSSPRSSP